MSKSAPKSSGPSKTKPSGPAVREVKPSGASRAIRETVESIVIAFVLAFLFRTFEAEAFVIPTGSMAPTLQGRHKALNCPKCGYRYRVSASGEVDRDSNRRSPRDFYNHQVVSTTCPMCRYPDDAAAEEPSYNGDRILVAKFAYDYREPERWDVIVFKFPGDAQTNYIKRLVGLPGETIRIQGGDLYARKAGESDFTICRKSPTKLQAMLQDVFDNDYLVPELLENGWLPRWNSIGLGKLDAGDWKTTDNKLFVTDGSAARDVWLRYAHSMPTRSDWEAMSTGTADSVASLWPR